MTRLADSWARGLTRRIRSRVLLVAAGATAIYFAVLALVGWLEQDNNFCTSCHLHQEIYQDYYSPEGSIVSLAAGHRVIEKPVLCIGCHGLEGLIGRTRTLMISTRAALKFLLGHYESEPDFLPPLPDPYCIKCHPERELVRLEAGDYHPLTEHLALDILCTECHVGHPPGDPELQYMVEEKVERHCVRCHPQL